METRKLIIGAIFIVMAIAFIACPYSSSVPLGEPNIKVDPSIYGKWTKIDEYNDFPKYLLFSKEDGKRFKIEQYEFSSSDSIYSISGTYVCHFTQIGDVTFANMLQDGVFYFYKIDFETADKFALFEVTDNVDEKFSNSDDIFEYFDQSKDLSFFYNKDEEYYVYSSIE